LEIGPSPVASTARLNEDQIRFVLPQGQVVPTHFDFHRVAERRESDQFNGRSHQQAHFEKATAVFGGHSDFGNGSGGADREGGQRLTDNGHNQATFSSARSGSTQMASANSALMPRRALQTWQMTLLCWLSNLMRCSSQKPISRRRREISGEALSCLIRQAVPTLNLLSGQIKDDSRPWLAFTIDVFLLTARQGKVIETGLQEGFRWPVLSKSSKGGSST
jgi:hypothetical protein